MKKLAAAGIITAFLIFGAVGSASVGRFDSNAKIVGGSNVKVGGPFSLDADETGAVIHATVSQGSAKASGDATVSPGASSWSATLAGSGSFHDGKATATAKATVTLADGSTESYNWSSILSLH